MLKQWISGTLNRQILTLENLKSTFEGENAVNDNDYTRQINQLLIYVQDKISREDLQKMIYGEVVRKRNRSRLI